MYLYFLTDDQRRTFFTAAEFLADCDGRDPREEALIARARLEFDLVPETNGPTDLQTILGALAAMETVSARKALALELAGVVAADGESSDDEHVAFAQMLHALGLGDDQTAEALDLAERMLRVTEDTEIFVSEGA